MLRTIGLIVIAIVVGILAYAGGQPDSFRIERRIGIKAPPETIYPLIADFRGWTLWSPWEKKDPAMKRSFSGADSGVGAVYEWSGNSQVGAGRMEISQTVPPVKVTIDMRFTQPMAARNTAEFLLDRQADATAVTWVMSGPAPFLARLMGLFVSMDDMVGGDFEKGLLALKAAAETRRP